MLVVASFFVRRELLFPASNHSRRDNRVICQCDFRENLGERLNIGDRLVVVFLRCTFVPPYLMLVATNIEQLPRMRHDFYVSPL